MTIVHLIFLLTITSISAESLKAKEKKHDFSLRNDARTRNSQEWKRSHKTLNFGKHVSSKSLRSNNLPKFQRNSNSKSLTTMETRACHNYKDQINMAKMAPILVTNHKIRNHDHEYDYMYLWEADYADDDAKWNMIELYEHVDTWAPAPNYFKIRYLSEDTALEKIKHWMEHFEKKAVLFHVHGWNADIYDVLCNNYDLNTMTDYLVVPVIWQVDRGVNQDFDYYADRTKVAPNAGLMLAAQYEPFFKRIKHQKSWLCHSMGCYVTQHFMQEVTEKNSIPDEVECNNGIFFKDIFLVAPDVRYDLFNEFPFNAGEGKNECGSNEEWKSRNFDCRSGGADALIKMASNLVHVYWNADDEAGSGREFILSFKGWPLSNKSLLSYGNDEKLGGLPEKQKYKGEVTFRNVQNDRKDITKEHNFHVWNFMGFKYNAPLYGGTCALPKDTEIIVTVKQAHTCPSDWADANDTEAEVYVNVGGQQIMCGKTRQVRSQDPVFNQRVSCGKWELSAIQKGFRIGFKLIDADANTGNDRLGGLSFDKSLSENYNGSFELGGSYDCNPFRFKKSTVHYGVSLN